MARLTLLSVLFTLQVVLIAAAVLLDVRPASAEPACTCRGPGGKRVELGATLCLSTPTGPRLARCVMDVNILSWQVLDAPCIVSLTPLPDGRHRLAGLAARPAVPEAP